MSRNRSSSSASVIKFFTDRVSLFSNSDDNTSSTSLPIVVNPGASHNSSSATSHDIHVQDEEPIKEIPLPAAELFTFDSIISTVQEEYDAAKQSLQYILAQYKSDLTQELDHATTVQTDLTTSMAQIDKLAARTLKQATTNTNRATSQVNTLEKARVDKLAHLATLAYDTLSSITHLLHEIDNMLPPDERLVPSDSLHRAHYPDLHDLLTSTHEQEQELITSLPLHLHSPKPRRAVSMSALHNEYVNVPTSCSSIATEAIQEGEDHEGVMIPRSESTRPMLRSSDQHIPENYPRSLWKNTSSPTPASPVATGSIHDAQEQGRISPSIPTSSVGSGSAKDRLQSLIQKT